MQLLIYHIHYRSATVFQIFPCFDDYFFCHFLVVDLCNVYKNNVEAGGELPRGVIQWHTPCRGGYHPPGCFPNGETTSAHCAANAPPTMCMVSTPFDKLRHGIIQHRCPVRPIRFCPKICNVGGRIISVMLWCDRHRRSLYFNSLRSAPPYTVCATELLVLIFRDCIVGALRRRCFPMRETTGRIISAPTNATKYLRR